ncbi:MAG: hypothetical protein U0736_20825 [Gemmataceae bacterium]
MSIQRTVVDRKTGQTVDALVSASTTTLSTGCRTTSAEVARIAHEAGFQFVDLKQCHRLPAQRDARRANAASAMAATWRTVPGRRARSSSESAEVPGLVVVSRLERVRRHPLPQRSHVDAPGEPCLDAPVETAWGTRHRLLTPDLTEPLWWVGRWASWAWALVNVSLGNRMPRRT